MKAQRQGRGQCFIELAVAGLFLIPVSLFGVDVITLVLANAANDTVAKNAARAAANQPNPVAAQQAALKAVSGFKTSPVINQMNMLSCNYPASKDVVTVETQMLVKYPVAFPGFSEHKFLAKSVQPIVSL